MSAARALRFPRPRAGALAVLAALMLAALQGCLRNEVAGGSSEVDNPQIKVTFVDDAGVPLAFTGSIALFVEDQNPAIEPEPLLEVKLDGDSAVYLGASVLGKTDGDGAPVRFNLLARGQSDSGALLKSLSYDPATKALTVNGALAPRLEIAPAPLVRYTASVSLDVNGPERVFVPGSPFQSVVVADSFAFERLPQGVFPLRVYRSNGTEVAFADSLDTRTQGHFAVDSTAPEIPRPITPQPDLAVDAGADQSVFTTSETFLSGQVTGASPQDKRLGVLWRQIPDAYVAWAHIERPTSLHSRVRFMWPGVYRFVLTVNMGHRRVEDTVTVGVQWPSTQPAFFAPGDSAQLWSGIPQAIKWFAYDPAPDTLDVEFSRDGGATWQVIFNDTPSLYGFNERYWIPEGPAATNCFLRLRRRDGSTVATSPRFSLQPWVSTGAGWDDKPGRH